ncbi:hypothetical protein FPHYL_4158 [Fusarium phyllophilum]|uniref:Uncharacterized protein n=1 Tax=Fusarium phyllophilum TaxID=47803 RepID=A0A8H5K0T3_9HYPO|nr:hypothetical protein FPHYL_4158 [Fusarium phyllophilum]
MLTNWFLQLAVLTVTILPRLADAGSDPAPAYGTVAQPSLDLPDAVSNASSTIESEALLEECDPTITVCGTTANVKVVRTHNSTSYVTNYHVHEEITVCKLGLVTAPLHLLPARHLNSLHRQLALEVIIVLASLLQAFNQLEHLRIKVVGAKVPRHLRLPSSRHPPPPKACPGACMEVHLEALLEPQELQLAQVFQELHLPRVLPRPLRLRPREALLNS